MTLKKVIRRGVLETNSSSSHSVCICSDSEVCKAGDHVWDLDLREDGTLFIPVPAINFGWDFFKTNRCLMKIQYAYGLAFHCCAEKQYIVTDLIKRVTGAKKVVIEWVEEYKKKEKEQKGILGNIYVETPEIDHQSLDLYDEVFENEDTLKDFIFNPKSWLYGGNDGSDDPSDFKTEWFTIDEDRQATLTIHFDKPIGDMDFDIHDLLSDSENDYQSTILEDDRISGMYIDNNDEIKFIPTIGAYRNNQDIIDPQLLKDENNKLVFAVFPINSNAWQSLMSTKKSHVGLNTVQEIIQITGIDANVPGGFQTYPVSINSKIFGKLC